MPKESVMKRAYTRVAKMMRWIVGGVMTLLAAIPVAVSMSSWTE